MVSDRARRRLDDLCEEDVHQQRDLEGKRLRLVVLERSEVDVVQRAGSGLRTLSRKKLLNAATAAPTKVTLTLRALGGKPTDTEEKSASTDVTSEPKQAERGPRQKGLTRYAPDFVVCTDTGKDRKERGMKICRRGMVRALIMSWRAAFVLTAVAVTVAVASPGASADRLSAAQLQAHGWVCRIPAGDIVLHCRAPGSEPPVAGPTEVHFLLFDTSGTTFLGTELLIRSDLYAGQLCEGTPIGTYELIPVGPGYYACSHFFAEWHAPPGGGQ